MPLVPARRRSRLRRRSRPFALALLSLLALSSLWAPAVGAAGPVAVDESVPATATTTVPLEATTAGTTEMTFAIASAPGHGTLGSILNTTCAPTGSGGTDCTASVVYTPNQCASGPDSFTYTATDPGSNATSSPAIVTLSPGPTAPTPPPPPTLPQTGAAVAGVPFSGAVQNALPGATVDYGDGSGAQPLTVDAGGGAHLARLPGGGV